MNQFAYAIKPSPKNEDPGCSDIMKMAERELAAFFHAVTELFGSEQAQASAEDWLSELKATSNLPASTRQWRLFTVKVLARLANRLNASPMSIARTLAYPG